MNIEIKLNSILSIHRNHYTEDHDDLIVYSRASCRGVEGSWRHLDMNELLEIKSACYKYCLEICETRSDLKTLKYSPSPFRITTHFGGITPDKQTTSAVVVGINKTKLDFLLAVTIN